MKKILLCLIALSLLVSACKKNEKMQKPKNTRTVVDQVGNTVVLPEKVERVVIASVWPLASVYCLEFGTEHLVGLDPAIISAAENSQLIKIAPDISKIPSDFSKNGSLNAEELLKLNPDVVLYSSGVMEDYEIATKAGIPAVGFSLNIKDFNGIETINSWIELLGQVMDRDLANSIFVERGKEIETMVKERVAQIPESEKPNVMLIHRYSESSPIVAGQNSWADYWIKTAGEKNVAEELIGSKNVGMEQVYQWNPEKNFITNFTDVLPNDLYENKIQGADWSVVAAVTNGEVHKVPLGMYRWYVTCSDSPLMLLWMAKTLQPKYFEDIDFNKELKKYYKEFYKLDLIDEDIESIFEPNASRAGGIKKY